MRTALLPDETVAAALFDDWARQGRDVRMADGHRWATEQVLAPWRFDNQSALLDVGCGNGWAVRLGIARGAGRGVGVDVAPEMIRRAQAATEGDDRATFHVAPGAALPLADASMSHVLSVESLYYHPDPTASLREWARVARPAARLGIMIELYSENPVSPAWRSALGVEVHLLPAAAWAEIARDAGWSDVVWRQVQSPEPLPPEAQFQPSPYWPDYATLVGYRRAGSLLVTGTRA
jgi:SAM-dependent methyltransferase